MKNLCAAGTGVGRQEDVQGLCAQNKRLARMNARLRVGLVGVLMLGVGFGLGGLTRNDEDSVVAYVATDETMYRVYESGRIEYLRLDDDPPRTAHGVFDWGVVKIDNEYTLRDRP